MCTEADDSGGEMDPHGADERGNPLGGLVFSNAFPSSAGNATAYKQVIEWHKYVAFHELRYNSHSKIFCPS